MNFNFLNKNYKVTDIYRGEEIHKILSADYDQLDELPNDLFDQINDKKLVGIILRNVVSDDEIRHMLSRLDEVPDHKRIFTKKNKLYPRGFASYMEDSSGSESGDFSKYFTQAQSYIDHFEDDFGVDVPARLTRVFEHFGSGRTFKFLEGEDDRGVFPHSQFRTLYPNTGCMPVHCGNVFHVEYEKFYERLSAKAKIKDQKSFFILMQSAQKGGKLVLFDILWEKGQRMIPDDALKLSNGKLVKPMTDRKVRKMELNIRPGDMLLFSGGPVWHRVTTIKGKRDRITLGGFFTTSADDKHIVSWA